MSLLGGIHNGKRVYGGTEGKVVIMPARGWMIAVNVLIEYAIVEGGWA
jgi:hypothetical protein